MDRLKIGFEYFKLGLLYILLLLFRLFCFISIKDLDTEWFRRKGIEIPVGFTIVIALVDYLIDKRPDLSIFIVVLILVICYMFMGIMLIISIFFCEFEYLLDVYLRKRFEKDEERFGRKKEKNKMRKFCIKAQEASCNFFSYGWIFAITFSICVILFFQTSDNPVSLEIRLGQAVGAFVSVIGIYWKRRYYYYINRQYNETRERKSQKKTNDTYSESNSYYEYQNQNDDSGEYSPIMCGFFNGCTNFKDVKKIYHNLARSLHPDAGGDPDRFRMLKQEYEYVKKKWNEK